MDYKVRIIKDYSKQSKMFGSEATGTSDLVWVFSNWCTYRGDEFVSVRVSGQALEIPCEGFEVFDPRVGKWCRTYRGDPRFPPQRKMA